MKERIIVCGSRNFCDQDLFDHNMDALLSSCHNPEIISGHARGADKIGELYAKTHGIPCKIFPAQWDKYGKRAGYLRNQEMLQYAIQTTPVVAAFWDEQSRGTADMIRISKAAGAEVHVYKYKP